MKIVPVQKKDSELELSSSSGGYSFWRLKDFFSVDHKNRWPVQGWSTSSGDYDPKLFEVDGGKVAAEESSRAYTLDKESRWPLQGWCKGRQPAKASPGSELSRKPSVQSRWPQGW